MSGKGIWWIRRQTRSRWLARTGGWLAVSVFMPILIRSRRDGGGLADATKTIYGEPFGGWTLPVTLVVGLVFLSLVYVASRWITQRTGRECTSLNGWVTLTTCAGTAVTIAVSVQLFPHQWTAALLLTGLCAVGIWHLVGQVFFGVRDGGGSLSS